MKNTPHFHDGNARSSPGDPGLARMLLILSWLGFRKMALLKVRLAAVPQTGQGQPGVDRISGRYFGCCPRQTRTGCRTDRTQ